MTSVQTGLDRVAHEPLRLPGRGRVALLCNASSTNRTLTPTAEVIRNLPGVQLVRILSPQHGFGGEKQDNMVESPDSVHPGLGVPIHSLYSHRREPSAEDLEGVDALIIDLQDVGTRVYTFLTTAALAIGAARRLGVEKTILLDRPNPIGGAIEGPILDDRFRSFVGMVDIPLRHGSTIGEFSLYAASRLGTLDEAEAASAAAWARGEKMPRPWLEVIALQGWKRGLYYDETGLPWTSPSPNMPTLDTAIVYPGQVCLEGTNLSEGRGTTHPFEWFGAPYLAPDEVRALLLGPAYGHAIEGIILRPICFQPTFQKHQGLLVQGYQIHPVDRRRYRPVLATTAILSAILKLSPGEFAWKKPPYEYDETHLPIDLIYGTDQVRLSLEAGEEIGGMAEDWDDGLKRFEERIRPYRIYGD